MNDKVESEYKDIAVELLEDIKNNVKSMRVKQGRTFKVIGSIYHSNKPLRIKSKNKDHPRIHVLSIIVIMKEIVLNLIYYYIICILVSCRCYQESNSFINETEAIESDLFNNFSLLCSIEIMVKG